VLGDADKYMDPAEKKKAMENDPYPAFRKKLIDTGVAKEDQLAKIEADIEAQLDEAVNFALESPFPDLKEVTRDVYGDVA
jgi:pyruvate dehydrogenase E1 component alpha subunit